MIHALARIEPANGLISVGARPGARVESVLVKEGDEIKAGQPLVVLEGKKAAEVQLAQAEAQKQAADQKREWKRRELEISRKREDRLQSVRLESLQTIYTVLQTRWSNASKTLQDVEKIPNISQKDKTDFGIAVDRIRVESNHAYLELEQAKADKDVLESRRKLEDDQLQAEGPEEEILQRQIELARTTLDQTTITAPASGTVIEILSRPGEVSSGPVLLLADLSSMVATAEVYETDVTGVVLDASAEVNLFGKRIGGKVTKISRTVGKNLLQNLDPRLPQDLRVVHVTIGLDTPEPASHYINMQVDAAISKNGSSVP